MDMHTCSLATPSQWCLLLAQAYTTEKVAASPDTLAPLVNIISALPAALTAEGTAEGGSQPAAEASRGEGTAEPGPSSSDVEVEECGRLVSAASKWASK